MSTDILLTTGNLSDAFMYGSYHSGIKQQEHHNTVGKLSKESVHSESGAFVSYFFQILSRAQKEREKVYKVSITGSKFARGRLPSQHPQRKKLKGK